MDESPTATRRSDRSRESRPDLSEISVLFTEGEPSRLATEAPPYFADLNLDQVLSSLIEGRGEYDLKPFFYTRLPSTDAIAYRHEVLRDLERERVLVSVTRFGRRMKEMRGHLAQERLYYEHQKKAWFLEAVSIYCAAVEELSQNLQSDDLRSRGLRRVRDYLAGHVHSERFTSLRADTKAMSEAMTGLRYRIHVKDRRITVSRYEEEGDYSAEVSRTFEKFRRSTAADYRVGFDGSAYMNDVEGRILGLVTRLHPEIFGALDEYRDRHRNYLDGVIARFDREAQFYLAYLAYMRRLSEDGLGFCYPAIVSREKDIHAHETFDIALANKLVPEGGSVVSNDFELSGPERIIVVTGPNQGGKTTFARMVGQLHHLATIGLPVPGSSAQLYLCDELFTHFEREEDITKLSGKLEDDLLRIHRILERATSDSVVIMNESFTSTTLSDAVVLGRAVMEQLIARDVLGVYVTFVDELASLGDSTVSMVSQIAAEDPATRTYKVLRQRADGLAYAAAIAAKYGLTYERLKERLDR